MFPVTFAMFQAVAAPPCEDVQANIAKCEPVVCQQSTDDGVIVHNVAGFVYGPGDNRCLHTQTQPDGAMILCQYTEETRQAIGRVAAASAKNAPPDAKDSEYLQAIFPIQCQIKE